MTEYYTAIGTSHTLSSTRYGWLKKYAELANRNYSCRIPPFIGAYEPFKNACSATGVVDTNKITPALKEFASRAHPSWSQCDKRTRKRFTQFIAALLGYDCLSPASFLILDMTPAVRLKESLAMKVVDIAKQRGIPIHNVAEDPDLASFLNSLKKEITC